MRKSNNSRRRRINPFKITALLILLTTGIWGGRVAGKAVWNWFDRSGWDRLKTIEVTGLERLQESDILRALNVSLGSRLMKLPLDSLAVRVEKVEGVHSARVLRKLPNRLVVRVYERLPIAAVIRKGIVLVDNDGVLFPLIGIGESVDLPVMSIDPGFSGSITTGKASNVNFHRAINLLSRLKSDYPTVYRHLGEIVMHNGQLELKMRQNSAVVRARNPEDDIMLTKLEQFLSQRSEELSIKAQYIDLRHPGLVITGQPDG